MAIVPPDASAAKVFFSSACCASRLRCAGCGRVWPLVMSAAEVGLQQIALLKGEALGQSKAGNCFARHRNHARPIDGGHAHLR